MKIRPLNLIALLWITLTSQNAQSEVPATAAQGIQDPEIAPALEASLRVDPAKSEIVPSEIAITRGDTIRFEGVLRDADGIRVTGAAWGVFAVPGIFQVQAIKSEHEDSYLLWGEGIGDTALRAVIVVPRGNTVVYKDLARVPVRVREWPAARIEIEEPAYGAYVGSEFRLGGRVITDRETEHASAVIEWSSGGRDVATITPDGLVRFNKPGPVEIRAASEGLRETRVIEVKPNPVAAVSLETGVVDVRTGDVVRSVVHVEDKAGRALRDVHVAYSVRATSGADGGAVAYEDGVFVGERPGTYLLEATAGGRSAAVTINVVPRRVQQRATLVGRGLVPHVATSDLWVFEGADGRDYAYTGTHAHGGGERMFVWDVTDPRDPALTDSVLVDARVVNDVKVNADATLAVITREAASDRKNGIVILDISDPAHPAVLSQFTDRLTAGIHNVWIYGDLVYAINDGTRAIHIVDISDPEKPTHVGRWELRPGDDNKYLHDVWVKDGLAYVSYWNDGLVILDVGAGSKGGTPVEPQLVSSIKYPSGHTHTAFRYGDYVFVGDEIMGCSECTNGPRGYVHVIDVRDVERPEEVAKFEIPDAGSHNIWVEDDRLYIAYYQGGLRVVDVSGELRGDLYAQGRQIAHFDTRGERGEAIIPNSTMAWGPQPFKGHIFVSDRHSGLWIVRLEPQAAFRLP